MSNLDTLKHTVLTSALEVIPTHGWTPAALEEGARNVQVDPNLVGILFPSGGKSAYELFVDTINAQLIDASPNLNLPTLRTTEKVEACLIQRLNLLTPHKAAMQWSRTFHSHPRYAIFSSKMLFRIVDTIWHLSGDTSLDYNYYTKRALLGYVYSNVFSKWLDAPTNYEAHQFIPYTQDALNNVLKVPKYLASLKHIVDQRIMGGLWRHGAG